jgi:hypothetical protein
LCAAPRFKFSHHFSGTIWNTLTVSKNDILVIETRDDQKFQAKFSALDFKKNKFIWKNLLLKETWWIGMTAAHEKTLLLHTFVNKGNPDHKNLIAFDIFDQKIRWEVEEFSFFDWNDSEIQGYRTNDELVQAEISIDTGALTEKEWVVAKSKNDLEVTKRPVLYSEGTVHFETIKKFLGQKTGLQSSKAMEYLEYGELIIISAYIEENGLANYLLVFDKEGVEQLREKLGENLQGLGVDTFFMLSGCLFLVKNKSELVVYSVYD